MPKVTVVPADHLIIVNDEALIFQFDAPENMHALQWRGDTGNTEWTDGPNKSLTAEDYDEQVSPFVALWEGEKKRLEAELAAAEEVYNSIENVKARKLNEINSLYQQAIATLTPTYPNDERLTFDKQEQEARAWLADNSTSTPFIDALAAGRQMDKTELVNRIIVKADVFAIASGLLTGQRQRYEDLLDAANTVEDVAAIIPEYSLPEAA